jgi:hypothetical protein
VEGSADGDERAGDEGAESNHVMKAERPLSARIHYIIENYMWTHVFYVFVSVVAIVPFGIVWHYWHEAKTKGWSWTSQDRRNMYVDGVKTIITASGVAVALLASSSVSSGRTINNLIAFPAKIAVVCLISCVCLSLVVILALLRGHERAKARNIEEQRKAGTRAAITEGKLNTRELLCILVPSGLMLSFFFVGFVFLGRIVFLF